VVKKDPKKKKAANLPRSVHALAAIGEKSEQAAKEHFSNPENGSLFKETSNEDLFSLAEALNKNWDDDQAAEIISAYKTVLLKKAPNLDISQLCRWILAHPNDTKAVLDCMQITPPQDIDIVKVLSRAGSQKLVFLATWRLAQRQVVLKRFIGPPEITDVLFRRESLTHPLRIDHININKTYLLPNKDGEQFLVEEYIRNVLNDEWRSNGVLEAANLINHISSAISHLQSHANLVHGDIKPDNIARKNGNYVLLDFGICRLATEYTPESTPTGSLRTRPPELITASGVVENPLKLDVWSLGATVFNSIEGRFPLFDKDETPPRVSTLDERKKFELILQKRIEEKWDDYLNFENIPDQLKNILENMLKRDPKERLDVAQLLKKMQEELSAFLRKTDGIEHFSSVEKISQLDLYLPEKEVLSLMPLTEKQQLYEDLNRLIETANLPSESDKKARELLERIPKINA
jgi:serine/threonine protein kinase